MKNMLSGRKTHLFGAISLEGQFGNSFYDMHFIFRYLSKIKHYGCVRRFTHKDAEWSFVCNSGKLETFKHPAIEKGINWSSLWLTTEYHAAITTWWHSTVVLSQGVFIRFTCRTLKKYRYSTHLKFIVIWFCKILSVENYCWRSRFTDKKSS